MFVSIRSALLIAAAVSASSVAPAKVGPTVEPLITAESAAIPTVVVPEHINVPAPAPQSDAVPAPAIPVQEAETPEDVEQTLSPKVDLATLVSKLRGSDPGSRQLECLAAGIYFESKGEPLLGQLAVGEVIANRAASGRFANTYCGVLFQRGQFSFVRGRSWPKIPKASRQWKTAVAIAKIVDRDLKDSAADDALFFHAKRVRPGWRLRRVASIGNHIFYR